MKKINRYLALLFILFLAITLPAVASADTNVSGVISTDTTWTLSDSPYIVTGSTLVNSGVNLTVEPGVVVRFDSGVGLQINGTLIAIGTDTDNITFTSNQSTPAAGDWAYIFFTDSSTDAAYDADGNYTDGSILEYCVVEYTGSVTSLDNHGALRMDNAHPFINYCTIMDNSAAGINAYNLTGTLKVTNSTISDNTGGGISVSSTGAGITTISNNTINNNTGSIFYFESGPFVYTFSGSGIFVRGGTTIISNNTVSNNTASATGGGIFVFWGTTTISNNIVSNNNNSSGIHLYYYYILDTTFSGTISDNTISNNDGSGVYVEGLYVSHTASISNNTISNNNGRGVYTYGGTYTISDNTIGTNGGGIYAYGYATISDNIISNNDANSGGGGVYASGTITIFQNTISNNIANVSYYYDDFGNYVSVPHNGGGIRAGSSAIISNNTIAGNIASGVSGGIYGGATITNNTIIGNSAENASAVYYYSSVADQDFKNNTITENIATGAAPTYTVSIGGNPLFNYNDIFNNTATYELWNNNAVGSANLDATNNWWGTSIESEIQAKIYDWFDDSSKGIVDYYPYLDSPVTSIIPDISVSPTSHDFGSVEAGSASTAQTFTISNTGTAELVIKAVYLTGENPYQFSIQNENCRGATIAPSGSCTVEAVFSPTKTGALSAILGIGSNDPDTPRLYTGLSGTGVTGGVPDISASPGSKDFGSVNAGSSVSQTFTISNTGTEDLIIRAVYLTGTNPYQFSIQSDNCSGATIALSGSCTVEVMFSPTKEGALNAVLGIGSNDPDTPKLYTGLSGTGIATTTYIIKAVSGANGNITPSGEVTVNEGSDQTFTIIPDIGSQVADVLVDDVSVGAVTTYTFTNVTGDHTIIAAFCSN